MMFLAGTAGLLSGCQDLEEVRAYAPEDVVAPVLGNLPSEIVITAQNMALETVEFTWQDADFGVDTQVSYSVEASLGNGEPLPLFIGFADTSTEQPYDALNAKLALAVEDGGLGVPVDTPTAVDFYVSATIGTGYVKVYSAPKTITMTVTAAERVYPTIKVVGNYCGWSHGTAQKLFSFTGDEVKYEAMVDFGEKAADGWKISAGVDDWTDSGNYGLDGNAPAPAAEAASITLINSGSSSDIKAYSKRFYHIGFDRSTLTLTKDMSFDRLGAIGDATPAGWDEDGDGDVAMEFDPVKQRFWVDLTLVEGSIKFRADNVWGEYEWGGDANGNLELKGGNIAVPAGNYRIYVDLNNSDGMTYELNAADYGTGGGTPPEPPQRAAWYLHGQTVATPDWGETAFVGAGTDGFKLVGVEVAANSEFLYKTGDESTWMGPAASLGTSPYPVTVGEGFEISTDKVNAVIAAAGTYDYWLLPKQNVAYVMTAGEKPFFVADSWGIVGSLTAWDEMGDMSMTAEGDYLVRKNVFIGTDYEFKIRFNNAWDDSKNYGLEADGVVEPDAATPVITSGGSKNMKVSAEGVYDIYFDLAGETLWVMTAGETPTR